MNDNNLMDQLILIMQRVKSADFIYSKLIQIHENLLFDANLGEPYNKYALHIRETIADCIKIIESNQETK